MTDRVPEATLGILKSFLLIVIVIDCRKVFNFMRYTLLVLSGDVLFKILWCP